MNAGIQRRGRHTAAILPRTAAGPATV